MGESQSKEAGNGQVPNKNNGPQEETKANEKPTEPKEMGISAGDFVTIATEPFTDVYNIKEVVGFSSFGEVRKVIHKETGLVRTAKFLKKDNISERFQKKLFTEIEIMRKLDHPNIMRIYELFEDKAYFYVVTEHLEGGELFDRISKLKSFSERDAARIMKQILSAIIYCHRNNITHRDIKPENFVYETKEPDSNLKLFDFGGASVIQKNAKLKEVFGSAYYIAPEVLAENYNEKCDIWSAGVILFMLLSGTPPFPGKNSQEIIEKVKVGTYNFNHDSWANVSEDAKRLITRMMEISPEKRYSAQEAINDPWFSLVLEKEEVDFPIAKNNLEQLKNFGFESKMQEATWVFIVSYFSTKEDKAKLLQTFKALDVNNDGVLTKEELIKGYIEIMGMAEAEAIREAENVMASLDSNKSGYVDYTEFVTATISKINLLKRENLEAAFKIFDKDGDGVISAMELKFLFHEAKSYGIPENFWEGWIKEADKNLEDGGLTLEEFKTMMISLISKV